LNSQDDNKRNNREWIFFSVLIVSILVGFSVGGHFQQRANADRGPYKELEKFAKILQFIESNYVDKVNSKTLIEGAIKGMLAALDPHSNYLSQEVFKEMKVETSGKFGGLGIEVSIRDGLITVVAPIEDSPAYKAGIKSGDQIVKIGDKPTKNLSLENTISLMRGKPGTPVKVFVSRKGAMKWLEFNIVRESIRVQSVKFTHVQGDVGYIRISQFIERTSEDLEKAFAKLSESKKLAGIILDLRGNPGGLLEQAVKVSNLFIDNGPVVYTIGRDKTKKEAELTKKGKKMTDLPLVVLVDGASASASEIVAGALQDYGRGIIVGQRTFGKGSVQSLIPLEDESGLKLTVSRYYTPSGRSIQAKGIIPDVSLEDIDGDIIAQASQKSQKRLREENLEGHFENESQAESLEASTVPQESPEKLALTLDEKLQKDFMVGQAAGILKTMKLVQNGLKSPTFVLDSEKEDRSASSQKSPSKL
jgi:carboxyl-terminal processing protease